MSMNITNHGLAWKWTVGLTLAWVISFGFLASFLGIVGILFLGLAIGIAQGLALDIKNDWGYWLGRITICWIIGYFLADFLTQNSFSMREQLAEVTLFGVLGGSTSSLMVFLHLSNKVSNKLLWGIFFTIIGLVAGLASMGIYGFTTDAAIHSEQLWFLKAVAGITLSGIVYGLTTLIPVQFLSSAISKQESAR